MENLHTFVLDGHVSEDNWLELSTLQNLQHFSFLDNNFGTVNLEVFLESQPNLKTFRYRSTIVDSGLHSMVASHIPNVKNFGTISINHKNHLKRFKKLRCLELLITRNDGGNVFKMLDCIEPKYILKALAVVSYPKTKKRYRNAVEPTVMNQFTALTNLHLLIGQNSQERFLQNVLPHFSNVTKVVLYCLKNRQSDILQILQLLKNLRVLFIIYGEEITARF